MSTMCQTDLRFDSKVDNIEDLSINSNMSHHVYSYPDDPIRRTFLFLFLISTHKTSECVDTSSNLVSYTKEQHMSNNIFLCEFMTGRFDIPVWRRCPASVFLLLGSSGCNTWRRETEVQRHTAEEEQIQSSRL